jgi:ATP-dependent RNA helicase DDX19/DBP5
MSQEKTEKTDKTQKPSNTEKKSWADQTEEEEEELSKELENTSIPKNEPQTAENAVKIKATLDDLNQGVSVDVRSDDPSSVLLAAKTFEELNLSQVLLDGVYEMGFKKPSKIQESALPIILSEKNLIAQAQSGTGKTAAFVLGMLSKCDPNMNAPQAICICPTRELARQIQTVVLGLGKFMKIRVALCCGGEKLPKTIKSHVIVGTPGKILEAMEYNTFDPKKLRIFVLDEADQMIDNEALGIQTRKLAKYIPKGCQYLLFSATFKDRVREYGEKFVPPPRASIIVKKEDLSIKSIQQYYVKCKDANEKLKALEELYGYLTVGQSIIFSNTKAAAEWLSQSMTKSGHKVKVLDSSLQPEERDKIMEEFRGARIKVLSSTDVLSRGIDVLGVTLVINFDLPIDSQGLLNCETYLHRVGRSGRFGRSGIAINLIESGDLGNIKRLVDYFQRPIEECPFSKLSEFQEKLDKVLADNQREMLERAEKQKKAEEEEAKQRFQQPQAKKGGQAAAPIQINIRGDKREVTTQK